MNYCSVAIRLLSFALPYYDLKSLVFEFAVFISEIALIIRTFASLLSVQF